MESFSNSRNHGSTNGNGNGNGTRSTDMHTFQETSPTIRPKWKQRRYQLACLALVAFVIAAACGGVLISRSVKGFVSNDQGSNAAAVNPQGVDADSTSSSTESPALTASEMPSPLPTSVASLTPTITASMSTSMLVQVPSISNGPSVTPTMLPSLSMAPSQNAPDVFGLYVMGDVPYSPWEEIMLLSQLADMTAYTHSNAMFMVHVGDLQRPNLTLCVETAYLMASQYLRNAPLPTFVLAGDNDWADCPDPNQALGYYHKYFDYFERQWTNATTTVPRMPVEYNETYPEMWRFTYNKVLFISIQLIDSKAILGTDEWNKRMAANIQWVLTALGTDMFSAVVIFGQASVGYETREFFEGILPAFLGERYWTPVLYLHGDGHKWDLATKIQTQLGWTSFIDVQVDQGAFADPIIVEFSVDPANPLLQEHDLQYVFADGLIRIDRQRGRYPKGSDGRATTADLQPFPLN